MDGMGLLRGLVNPKHMVVFSCDILLPVAQAMNPFLAGMVTRP